MFGFLVDVKAGQLSESVGFAVMNLENVGIPNLSVHGSRQRATVGEKRDKEPFRFLSDLQHPFYIQDHTS